MKKVLSTILVLSILICMSGCSGTTDIEKRAVVQIAGIDIENNKYKVSMQVFAPDGEMLENKGGAKVDVITGTGNSIYSAIKEIEMKTGKEVFLGHNVLLFLGESTRNENLNQLLEYFTQGEYVFPGLDLVITNGNAYDYISMKLSAGLLSSQTMEDILKESIQNGNAKRAQLAQVVADAMQTQKSAAIPIVDVAKIAQNVELNNDDDDNNTQDEKILSFSKTAVYKNDKYLLSLDKNQTMGLKWLTDDIKQGFFSVNVDGVPVGISINKSKTTLRPRISEGKVVIDADIKLSATALGNLSSIKTDGADLENQIKKEIKNQIISQCESTQSILLNENSVDVLDIEKLLQYYEKDFYLSSRKDFESVIKNASYDISIKCNLKIHR